jgi:hypothetical protein
MEEAMYGRGGRVLTFDGKKVNFPTGWTHNEKNQECLKRRKGSKLSRKRGDEATEQGKRVGIALDKNDLAMASCVMASQLKGNAYHYAANMLEWREAHILALELMKRYCPLDEFPKLR